MTLQSHLDMMTEAGLISRSGASHDDWEYLFRHALLHEAAYESLLRQERRQLHLAVGQALERSSPHRLNDLAATLAYHFERGEDAARALKYYRRAGREAMDQLALEEGIASFSRALSLAEQLADRTAELDLRRQRGKAHDTRGDFRRARADYEAALHLARDLAAREAEWQVLLDLGDLWTSRDYDEAGRYFQLALNLAGDSGMRKQIAHSLNRLGNWHVNREEPRQGRAYHEEALRVFEEEGTPLEIAATHDLLGMATGLGADLAQSVIHYQAAITLLRGLDDPEARRILSSSLASLATSHGGYGGEMRALAATPSRPASEAEEALRIAELIGWRSGEAFALMSLSLGAQSRGRYGEALKAAERSLLVAEAIGHRQWLVAAHFALAVVFIDLLALAQAREHLRLGRTLAVEIRSLYWQRLIAAMLGRVHILRDELDAAEAAVGGLSQPEDPMPTTAQRMLWVSRAELALAKGEASNTLQILDYLRSTIPGIAVVDLELMPSLALLHGQALMQVGDLDGAQEALHASRAGAEKHRMVTLQWQIHLNNTILYRRLGQTEEAGRALVETRTIIDQLALMIPDQLLRDGFLAGAEEVVARACS
jgi:tetratricopeptide (TPR) repeat protein